jgi:hypothetical protein
MPIRAHLRTGERIRTPAGRGPSRPAYMMMAVIALFSGVAVAAPLGYVVARSAVGSAQADETSHGERLSGVASPGRPAIAAPRGQATGAPAMTVDPRGINVIPKSPPPQKLVDDCTTYLHELSQRAQPAGSRAALEAKDRTRTCEILLLADRGEIAPGTYTDAQVTRKAAEHYEDIERR